ncbi:MAG: cell division protein SepF [Oscillospiraceae bacterium]|nr:cell division protein SepF [Oscillospiraceae bacterium]
MSFWDNVKKFAQPYSDEDYDDYEEEMEEYEEDAQEAAPRARRTSPFAAVAQETESAYTATTATATASTGFNGQVLNMSSGKQEVVLFHAKTFDDAAKAADELRRRKAVILNMENVDKSLTRRVVDFLSGSVYALDGRVKKIAQSTYLFCPHNMDVTGDLENIQADADSHF